MCTTAKPLYMLYRTAKLETVRKEVNCKKVSFKAFAKKQPELELR